MNTITAYGIFVAFLSWIFLPALVGAGETRAEEARLTIQIKGFRSEEGKLVIALFNSKKDFTKKAIQNASLPIKDGLSRWSVKTLAPGRYAIALYHDANGNGRMDKNFFGVPREDYGFSRDAKPSFGPPKWQDAVFEVKAGENSQAIKIQRR